MLFLLQFLGATCFLEVSKILDESSEDHNRRICEGMYKSPNGTLVVVPEHIIHITSHSKYDRFDKICISASMDDILINWDECSPVYPEEFGTAAEKSLRTIILEKLRTIAPEIFQEISTEDTIWVNFANFLYGKSWGVNYYEHPSIELIVSQTKDKNGCTNINGAFFERYTVFEKFWRCFFEQSEFYYQLQATLRDYYHQAKTVFSKLYRHKQGDSMDPSTLACARQDVELHDLTTECLVRWFETASDTGSNFEKSCASYDLRDDYWDILVDGKTDRMRGVQALQARARNPKATNVPAIIDFAKKMKFSDEEQQDENTPT